MPEPQIARAAAARLAASFPGLPAQVERALDPESLDPPLRTLLAVDPVAVASLLVSLASFAWTIWNDLRDRHAARSPAEQAAALAAALATQAAPRLAAVPEARRVVIVQVVAEETVRLG